MNIKLGILSIVKTVIKKYSLLSAIDDDNNRLRLYIMILSIVPPINELIYKVSV